MEKNSEISERISKILETLNIKAHAFALKLGYVRSQTLYDIVNGKSYPSFEFLNKFQVSEYSEIISIDWLLTGRGEMLVNKYEIPVKHNVLEEKREKYKPKTNDMGKCERCEMKDELIIALRETIKAQTEANAMLKEKLDMLTDSEQKRKAS